MDVRQHPEDQERDKDQIYDVSDRNEPVAAPPQGRWVNVGRHLVRLAQAGCDRPCARNRFHSDGRRLLPNHRTHTARLRCVAGALWNSSSRKRQQRPRDGRWLSRLPTGVG